MQLTSFYWRSRYGMRYRKSYEPAHEFRDLWARVMFESSQNCTSRRRVQFENFQASRVTINHEMHEQVDTIFLFIIFSTKLLERATLYALRITLNASMVSNMLTCFI